MSELAALLVPCIRWDAKYGFTHLREGIDDALELGVGGFIFFGGPKEEVTPLIAELHARSRHPLLVSADLERGAGQQFPGLTGLPPLGALGALEDLEVMRRAARLTAREARSIGVNWDFAPCCDLDILSENPIIGTRALGSDPAQVAERAVEWIDACQSEGVLATAKHFPGHGRTTTDSHMELPQVVLDAKSLWETDLLPFRAAVDAGVASVMTAHVAFPGLDRTGTPATLSRPILTELLRGELGFQGLIVTDALIMDGVLQGRTEGEACAAALAAGCDLLLYPSDLDAVHEAIQRAAREGVIDPGELEAKLARRAFWADWARPSDGRDVTLDDVLWARQVADRVVQPLRGIVPSIGPVVDVVIVDDDLGGPYPPPSREPFMAALRALDFEARRVEAPTEEGRGAVVVAVFGDIRSWKGRPGYSAETRARVAALVEESRRTQRGSIVLQFSHPRLAEELPTAPNLLCCWGGERPMQEAAARRLV